MKTAFCSLMLLATCALAQTVEGTILNSVTGTGIPDAYIVLQLTTADKHYEARTDALGHFLLKNVAAGTYTFFYGSRDYLPSDLNARPMQQVEVSMAGPLKLEGSLSPRTRISGRVVDANGDGVANARLEVIPLGSWSTTTDATGTFELLLDQRGAYALSMTPPLNLKPPDPEPGRDGVLVWARTFYPGVPDLESASRIAVSGEAPGIQMKFVAAPAHAVRGVLLNPDGTPASKVAITLDDGQRASWQAVAAEHAESNSEGIFEFPHVVDGEWRIAADVEIGARKLRATQWIEMTGHELGDVKLRLAAPFPVRGHVITEAAQGTQRLAPLPVLLVPHGRSTRTDIGRSNWMLWPITYFEPAVPNVPGVNDMRDAFVEITTNELVEDGAVLARPDANGNLTLENVSPGPYRIAALPPPPPWYIAAVRLGEADVTNAEVEFSPSAPPVTVVYKTNGGTLRGTAEKCAAGIVLLIPQDPAMQSLGFLRAARCDSSDRYEFTAVRPGDYNVLAFAGGGGVPQLTDLLLSQANKVAVHVDESVSADLRAIPRPGY